MRMVLIALVGVILALWIASLAPRQAMTAPSATQPAIRPADGLFDQSDAIALGLPLASGVESVLLYKAERGAAQYCHHPSLGAFGERLFAMWSTGDIDEDSSSQRVAFTRSENGRDWAMVATLAPDPDGPHGPLRRTAGGFWTANEGRPEATLVAYFTTFSEPTPGQKWSRDLLLEAVESRDGEHWSEPRRVSDDFMINEAPRCTPSGRLLMTGENARGETRILISDNLDGLSGWRDAQLDFRKAGGATTHAGPAPPPNEPTWFARRAAGAAAGGGAGRGGFEMVLLMRDDGGSRRLSVSVSRDDGETWSVPVSSPYPDATAKARAGNLPDGRAYLISNPSTQFGRSPLVLSLSQEGHVFDRGFALSVNAAPPRFAGRYKGGGFQYPGALVYRDALFTIYSIAKEDVAVTRIPLQSIMP